MAVSLADWIGFNVLLLVLLAADLAFFGRRQAEPRIGRLVLATLGWMGVAGAVGWWIGLRGGAQGSIGFATGYLIEYALSLDNILLFVFIFSAFALPPKPQRRVLFWGVIGALVLRGFMILAGVALIARFSWILYLFGAYLLYAGALFWFPKKETPLGERRVVKLARRLLPLSATGRTDRFFVVEGGRRRVTLLFMALVAVEATDLVFAFDSIPAIFGVTTDPFVVYTSNACAILGLRSLYFLVAHAVKRFVYLQTGLGAVLVFIGAKMVLAKLVPVSTAQSLLVVGAIFAVTIAASLRHAARKGTPPAHSR